MSASVSSQGRSNFVTVLGWIIFAFAAMGVLGALMQNVMVNLMLIPMMEKQGAATHAAQAFGFGFMRWMVAFLFAFMVFVLYASWSFIQRKNWARKTFVVLFALQVVSSIGGFLMMGVGIGVFNLPGQMPQSPEAPAEIAIMFRVMGIVFGLFSAGMGVLFYWLIRRLRSSAIRAEFVHADVPG